MTVKRALTKWQKKPNAKSAASAALRRLLGRSRPDHQTASVIGSRHAPSMKPANPYSHSMFMASSAAKSAATRRPRAPATRQRSQKTASANPASVTVVMIRSASQAGSQATRTARLIGPAQLGMGCQRMV